MKAQTYEEFAGELQAWVNERVENSKNGKIETVEMPYVIRSSGWGCDCPYYYIGTNPNTLNGIYIAPIAPRQMPYEPTETGYKYIVTGHFTGLIKTKKYGETEYDLPQFKITEFKKNTKGSLTTAPKIIKTENSSKMSYETQMIGKWQTIQFRNQTLRFNDYYIFHKDGKFTHDSNGMLVEGTWKIENKHIMVYAGDFEPDFGEITSITHDKITVKESDETITIYKKINE